MSISRSEYRAVIKFLTWKKHLAENIFECLVNVSRDSALFYSTITRWVDEFKLGRTSLEDDTRAGRPVEATTDDCCHAVAKLVMGVWRLKVLRKATEVDISYGRVLNILHEHLGFSKVRARWAHVFWHPFRSNFRWKHARSCWLSTVQPRPMCCPV